MELTAIEMLLLDTLENEGEDNKLFYTSEHDVDAVFRWSEVRGVLAAVMGTMKSVAGEPLVTAHFVVSQEASSHPTVVGFVDLNEVLFVMVFVECALHPKIVEYYTRSSCALLVSLLGYPRQKLSDWRDPKIGEDSRVEFKLERVCQNIFECIRRDLRWETHLQFAFDGCVPAVTYPLETMARLSAFQVIEPLCDAYEVEGYALFYRNMLVVAKTTPDILKLLSQWLLHDNFDAEAETEDGSSLSLFRWFDAHYALYGIFPAIQSLVRIRHGDIQCFYLLRHRDASAFEKYKRDPTMLISTEDLQELLHFAETRLQRHYDSTLLDRRTTLASSHPPIWYCIVLDKLRHTLHGFKPSELIAEENLPLWAPMLELLACQPSASFQRQRVFPLESSTKASDAPLPTRKRWIPRVQLDVDSHELLLRPVRPEDDAGADISSGEAHIFPPVDHQLANQAIESVRRYPGGELHQEAERVGLADGRFVWVIANYYDVFDLFGVCDTAVPIARLEQEMDELLRLE